MKPRKKGAMLNLACQLVRDAFLNAFDVSVIVTKDTDQSKLCGAKQERDVSLLRQRLVQTGLSN